jgi:hypothetical protein
MEEWKLINGYDYSVSSLGRIRNNRTGRILKGVPNTFGYLQVFLYKNGRSKRFTVHQLVASYFLPDQMGKEINHINEDKLDNRVENLEYITHKENCNYGTRNSRMATKLSRPLIQCDLHGMDLYGNPVMYDYFSCYPIISYSQSNKQTIEQTHINCC